MGVKIKKIKVICTAPEGINLVVVKVETDQPGLYGLGCATFAYRHLTVKHLLETYFEPLLAGKDAENIEELWHAFSIRSQKRTVAQQRHKFCCLRKRPYNRY